MKYFKFAQISEETGKSWILEQPISGPSYPKLPGMANIIQLNQDTHYYVAEVDDLAISNPDNYIFEITAQERAQLLKESVQVDIDRRLDSIYAEENDFRKATLGKYDDTASIAGIYKYEQAKQLIADSSATASDVRAEASIRGVDPITLAERIVINHEKFRSDEVAIAGIRGMIYDRLKAFIFDLTNPDVSYLDFYSEEKIGEHEETSFEQQTEIFDVLVGKYVLALDARFKYR